MPRLTVPIMAMIFLAGMLLIPVDSAANGRFGHFKPGFKQHRFAPRPHFNQFRHRQALPYNFFHFFGPDRFGFGGRRLGNERFQYFGHRPRSNSYFGRRPYSPRSYYYGYPRHW